MNYPLLKDGVPVLCQSLYLLIHIPCTDFYHYPLATFGYSLCPDLAFSLRPSECECPLLGSFLSVS